MTNIALLPSHLNWGPIRAGSESQPENLKESKAVEAGLQTKEMRTPVKNCRVLGKKGFRAGQTLVFQCPKD